MHYNIHYECRYNALYIKALSKVLPGFLFQIDAVLSVHLFPLFMLYTSIWLLHF